MTILTTLGLTLGPLLHTIFTLFFEVPKSPLLVFWGLTPGPLVYTIFAILLYVLKSMLLMFWGLTLSNQQEFIPKVVDPF